MPVAMGAAVCSPLVLRALPLVLPICMAVPVIMAMAVPLLGIAMAVRMLLAVIVVMIMAVPMAAMIMTVPVTGVIVVVAMAAVIEVVAVPRAAVIMPLSRLRSCRGWSPMAVTVTVTMPVIVIVIVIVATVAVAVLPQDEVVESIDSDPRKRQTRHHCMCSCAFRGVHDRLGIWLLTYDPC